MNTIDIRAALGTAIGIPTKALHAAQAEAAALAPEVIALAEKAAKGIWLLPAEQSLLFHGLYALAAARRTEALPALLALLARPDHELDALFGDALGADGAALLVSLYDGNPEPLYALLADPGRSEYVRWTLFKAMARLAWEGRLPRQDFVAFLARFDDELLAPSHDLAWMGWQDAICLLGLTDFEDRLRAAWDDERGEDMPMPDEERADRLSRMKDAAENPADPSDFEQARIVPITDAVATLSWVEPPPAEETDPEDAAAGIRLSDREIDWLAGFLESDRQPTQTMDIEMLDGFFAAVAVTPGPIPPAEYLPLLWGDQGEEPGIDSPEQRTYLDGLLDRHMRSIAARLAADQGHEPVLVPSDRPAEQGVRWSEGFGLGVSLRQDAWEAVIDDPEAGGAFADIAALSASHYDPQAEKLSAKEREAILEALSDYPPLFAAFFRDGPRSREPVRVTKIGRNDTCPCGSGKKYKKCHGAPGAPPLN